MKGDFLGFAKSIFAVLFTIMSTVKDIESAIEQLDDRSLGQLSGWFEDYLAEKWERRFAADARAGKLDKLGEAADRAFEQGQCRPL
jgi:hypothetical protein